MPDVEWNRDSWDGQYDWGSAGEEWSKGWGGSEAQWYGSLFPRLHRLLPAESILEIAPGYGRWTRFLLPSCRSYIGVDLSGECVTACRTRFATASHASFVQNDGFSLDAVAQGIDFAFSFDSLVHVEIDVLRSYIEQILTRLTPSGAAFLHHSNMAMVPDSPNPHCRAASVSAALVAEVVKSNGGSVYVQELMNWGGEKLTDCMTTFGLQKRDAVVLHNSSFMTEAELIRAYQSAYS